MATKMSFDDSAANCVKHGGVLASVRSVWEQEFVNSMAAGKKAWIGGHDRNVLKAYVWVSGEDGPDGFYNNFKLNSPTHLANQDCIQLDGADGTWNDVLCSKKLFHFCQKDSSVGANSEYSL